MKSHNLIIILLLLIGIASCRAISKKGATENQDLIIEGKIIHNKSNKHSLNSEFVWKPDAHIIIRITYAEGMDAPSEIVLEKDFTSVKELPFHFKIYGNEKEILTDKGFGNYKISAKVINGSGEETYVGDLVSEYSYGIYDEFQMDNQKSTEYIDIEVFGLEDCKDENAGGFCTSNYRNGNE